MEKWRKNTAILTKYPFNIIGDSKLVHTVLNSVWKTSEKCTNVNFDKLPMFDYFGAVQDARPEPKIQNLLMWVLVCGLKLDLQCENICH